ncbi:MAG: peptidase domain-containing ABC transporter [Planctomycetes bacterium]|nr:peptidase domain-containing ABC transporter [Planctomycetota bacterium]
MFHRHAVVRQNDASDRGAAALATVAVHYRRPVGLQHLRDLSGTDRVGTNLLGLVQAARKLGFDAKAVHATERSLVELPKPAIAHIRNREGLGHFVVVHGVGRHRVVVADPARGIVRHAKADFLAAWTGYLILLRPDACARSEAGAGTAIRPVRRFLGLLSAHTWIIAEAAMASLVTTILGVATAFFIQHLVDSVLIRNEVRLLNALGVGMTLIVLFRTAFGALRQYLLAFVGRRVDLALVAGYSRHILDLPMTFFQTRRVGEILSRITDAGRIRGAISGATTTVVVDGLLVVSMTSVLYAYDCRLALLATLFVLMLILSTAAHHPFVRRRSREAMEAAAELSSHYVEDVSGIEAIKAFGIQQARCDEGESRLVRVVQNGFAMQTLGNSMNSAGIAITGLAGIAVLWYGGHRVMAGALSVGQLVFFHSLLGYLLDPLQRLASINVQLQDALIAIDRLGQVTDLPTEPLHAADKIVFGGVRGAVELRDVSFQYGCRAPALDKLTLSIPSGKTVAIVGESGSGKSTLLKLLSALDAPQSGRLLIDGRDYRDYDLASLRAGIGVVSQEPFLFTGSIRANIAMARPGASFADIVEVVRLAGLADFVDSLPERYDTILGERGASMSGGQRQRLALARALLRNPHLLVLDEATSHLDTATEREVLGNLRSILSNKTVVLVAHRLSTVRDADIIYVMRDGRVTEKGAHRELLSIDGYYADLWRSQSETESVDTARFETRPAPRTVLDGAGSASVARSRGGAVCGG